MRWICILLIMLSASPPRAEPVQSDQTLVARQAIRAKAVITEADVTLLPGTTPGALTNPADAVGLEARVTLYPGRPIRADQLGPPALIARNQIITLRYSSAGLEIITDGRALDRAGLGDRVRVMNLKSRMTVTGRVAGPGLVEVGS